MWTALGRSCPPAPSRWIRAVPDGCAHTNVLRVSVQIVQIRTRRCDFICHIPIQRNWLIDKRYRLAEGDRWLVQWVQLDGSTVPHPSKQRLHLKKGKTGGHRRSELCGRVV